MKKKIFSFITTLILLVGIGFTQNAYAASNWQQTSKGWTYFENGITKTGWVNDNGTWYYLIEDGTLDNSKTTTVMPNEIKLVYDMIKPFVNYADLKFAGMYHTINGDCFSRAGMEETNMYKFSVSSKYDIPVPEYYYNPPTGIVYIMVQGEVTSLGTSKVIYDLTKKITQDVAIENVKKYLSENKVIIPNMLIDAIDEYNNVYLVTCYSDMKDHVTTAGRYYVDKTTGDVIKMY